MRILIADNETCRALDGHMLARLAAYGAVDCVHGGRDAVQAYVHSGSQGLFYDLVVVDQYLTAMNCFATIDMIRAYESEQRKYGRRTMVCVTTGDSSCKQGFTDRYATDDRTRLLVKPVSDEVLERLAGMVVNSPVNAVPAGMRQPVSVRA